MYNQEASRALIELITNKDSYNNKLVKNDDSYPLIKSCLEKGADPNAALAYDAGTYPVLAQAIIRQNVNAVDILIKAGADIYACLTMKDQKFTMLELAKKTYQSNRRDRATLIIELLEKAEDKLGKMRSKELHYPFISDDTVITQDEFKGMFKGLREAA